MSDLTQRIAQLSTEERIRLEERLLAARKNGHSQRIPRRGDNGPAPLSFAQERLWFLHQLQPNSTLYNEQSIYQLLGPLQQEVMAAALTEIVRRHQILHTAYRMADDQVVQVVVDDWLLPLKIIDLQTQAAAEQEESIEHLAGLEGISAQVQKIVMDAHCFHA